MAELSKKEYLKRYLDGGKEKKKDKHKSKVKRRNQLSRIKIVDGDIDLKSIKFGDNVDDEVKEDIPVVAEIIDERPEHVKIKEQFESTRWKKFSNIENEDIPENLSEKDITSLSNIETHQHRKRQYDSDSDVSLPRKNTRKRNDSEDSDISPLRRPIKLEILSDDDNSTLKRSDKTPHETQNSSRKCDEKVKSRNLVNLSEQRKIKTHSQSRHDSDSDNSVERFPSSYTSHSNSSNSKHIKHSESSLQDKRFFSNKDANDNDSDYSPPRNSNIRDDNEKIGRSGKTLSGLSAGLQNATTLKKESQELRQREKKQITEMDDVLSGRNAETILRDRQTGLKRDLAEEKRLKDNEEKKKAEHQQKYAEWGKGIEQTEKKKSKISEDLYEMSKPLARYCDDEDLEESLKAAEREGDTMAAYIKKKKKTAPSVPQYNGPAPAPNRFGIMPGYRWDGVDRSNGFEKKFFERTNKSKATETEAYLWSVQNM